MEWYREGREAVARAKELAPITGKARNVILFLGDGMGITTVTASRILEGQQRGQLGEENILSFEKFPYTALIKTYNTDAQTDSAGTMSQSSAGENPHRNVIRQSECPARTTLPRK
jgi:alkaline phosphatase